MKIVFMGTPDFAVGALEHLIRAGHEIVLCVTQPDKPKGRGKELAAPPVKECAVKHGIPVFQPVRIKTLESVEYLKNYTADVFVVAAFGQILSSEILNMPKYGCINIHASLLPMYRGAAPIQWAILRGEEKAGVTIMQMNEGLDTGDMLLKDELILSEDETADSLHDRLSELGAKLIVTALDKLEKGELIATPQPEGETFYARILKKEDGLIDWTKGANEIERTIRGLYSWPAAYTFLDGKKLILVKGKVVAENTKEHPGVVTEVTKNEIVVQTGEGQLQILKIKPQGKKEMTVHDFLLGNGIAKGEQFRNQ